MKYKAKTIPISRVAWAHNYALMDQWKVGYDRLTSLSPEEQDALILSHMPSNTNSGYPFFERQSERNKKRLLVRFMEMVHYKYDRSHWDVQNDRPYYTAEMVMNFYYWTVDKELFFPFCLFYRIQPGDDGQNIVPYLEPTYFKNT